MISVAWRKGLRVAIAVVIGVLLYEYTDLQAGFWIPLTILLLVQETSGGTLRRGWQRFLGLLIGVSLGSLMVWLCPDLVWREWAIVMIAMLTFVFRPYRLMSDGFLIMPMVLFGLLLAILVPTGLHHDLLVGRAFDVLIGAVLAVGATLCCFPNTLFYHVETGIPIIVKQGAFYATAIFALFHGEAQAQQQAELQRQTFLKHLGQQRHYFRDWLYELTLQRQKRQHYQRLLFFTEKLSQILMSLHLLAQQNWPAPLKKSISEILVDVDDKMKHLVATVCLQTQDAPLISEVDDFDDILEQLNHYYLIAVEKDEYHIAGLLSWLMSDLDNLGQVCQAMLKH